MFTLRRQFTALALVATSVLSVPAMAETSLQSQLQGYLSEMVEQQIDNVRTEILSEVTQLVANTTYQAEPEVAEETLVADIKIRDLKQEDAISFEDIKGE